MVSCFLKKILRLSLAVGAVNVVLADIRPLPIGSSSSAIKNRNIDIKNSLFKMHHLPTQLNIIRKIK